MTVISWNKAISYQWASHFPFSFFPYSEIEFPSNELLLRCNRTQPKSDISRALITVGEISGSCRKLFSLGSPSIEVYSGKDVEVRRRIARIGVDVQQPQCHWYLDGCVRLMRPLPLQYGRVPGSNKVHASVWIRSWISLVRYVQSVHQISTITHGRAVPSVSSRSWLFLLLQFEIPSGCWYLPEDVCRWLPIAFEPAITWLLLYSS